MASPQQRKCSVCRNPGHNKRSCPDLRSEKKKSTKPHVQVYVIRDSSPSNHIVDLGDKKTQAQWHKVTAYKEKAQPKRERVTVNFADLIRLHNQKQETEKQVIPEAVVFSQQRKREIQKEVVRKERRPLPNPLTPLRKANDSIKTALHTWFAHITDRLVMKRFAASVVILCLLAMLPFPALSYYHKVQDDSRQIIEKSTNAFLALQSSTIAALNANLPQAQYDLSLALESFSQAKGFINEEHKALFFVAEMLPGIGTHVSSRTHLLQAGHHLALGNTYLVKGLEKAANTQDQSASARLTSLRNHISSALPQYEAALIELSSVNKKVVPAEYQEVFDEFKLLYAAFVNDLGDLNSIIDTMNALVAGEEEKRFLIIGQNSNELRATGGFMGSFAIATIRNGKIQDLTVPKGGTYDVQGQLREFVKPPVPLQVVNARWEFQDANWFVDFSESAQKISWFYENAWNHPIDGVIAVNSTVLERVLVALGPVTTEQGLTLDQDGAIASLRQEIESANDGGSNEPKAVLAEGLDAILSQLEDADTATLIRLLAELGEALEEKEIQIYAKNQALQETIRSFGWSGEIVQTKQNQDYLMVAATNIGGGKSDARMRQTITHQALVDPVTGEVTNTVIIDRTHTGSAEELFYGAANMSYIRIHVPEGAELIEAGGFTFPPEEAFLVPDATFEDDEDLLRIEKEIGFDANSGTRISEEYGKTVFGNWMAVGPGESSQAYIVYTLPFTVHVGSATVGTEDNLDRWSELFLPEQKDSSRYSLFVQKQSGITSDFSSSLIYPEPWRPIWATNDEIDLAQNGAVYHAPLDRDTIIGVAFEKAPQS